MTRLTRCLAVLPLLLLVLPGCSGDSFESLRKKQVDTVNEAIQLLAGIHDRDSADKARPKLKKLGDRWRDLDNRVTALENVSADEQAKAKPLSDQLDSLIAHYLGETLRVAFVPGGKEALAEIGDVNKRR